MVTLKRSSFAAIAISSLLVSLNTNAGEKIIIPEAVPFSKTSNATAAVKEKCELGEKVSAYIDKYSKLVEVGDGTTAKHIDMEISEVFAPGGGAWSGPKWLEVTGTLKDGTKEIASFRAKRFSTGGAFGGFKGTCGILARCTKALGKDIATWLKEPTDNAELGDAK